MAATITTRGKNMALDRVYNGGTYSYVYYAQIGMCGLAPAITDTKVISPIPILTANRETVDACDAITGWTASGDGTSVVLNETAGDRLEGTGALDLRATHSSGTATYYKTVSSVDGTTDYMFVALYINDLTKLTDATDTIIVDLGTGGFTNYNTYAFDKDTLRVGWNAIVCDISSYNTQEGSGLTISDIDSVRINLKIEDDLADDDIIMDWWHTYPEADTYLTFSSGYPTFNEALKDVSTRLEINSTQANGYILRELGFYDSTKTYLYRRDTYSSTTKDLRIALTWDLKDKIL